MARAETCDLILSWRMFKRGGLAVAATHDPAARWVWLRKRDIEFEMLDGGYVTVTLPRWLAINKGFVAASPPPRVAGGGAVGCFSPFYRTELIHEADYRRAA